MRNGRGVQRAVGKTKPDRQAQALAANYFQCGNGQCVWFDARDPFNPSNKLSGFVCKQEGRHSGSLFITAINEEALGDSPLVIFGVPRIQMPYKFKGPDSEETEASDKPFKDFGPCSQFYLSKKWNGDAITFYKYRDGAGEHHVTAKSRFAPFLLDTPYSDLLSLTLEALLPASQQSNREEEEEREEGEEGEGKAAKRNRNRRLPFGLKTPLRLNDDSFPTLLNPLRERSVQSLTFELCGAKNPHLIRYHPDLFLAPLFSTTHEGSILPLLYPSSSLQRTTRVTDHQEKENQQAITAENERDELLFPSDSASLSFLKMAGPHPFQSSAHLQKCCQKIQQECAQVNKEHRERHSLPYSFQLDRFLAEGFVLYLLNGRGAAISRDSLFKIKPRDIEPHHREQFDLALQAEVLYALDKLHKANTPVTDASLCEALDMSPTMWKRYEQDIMAFVEGRPFVEEEPGTVGEKRILLLMGVPGSGKSTLANRLLNVGFPQWERVNQDEMGTRQKCEAAMQVALKNGKNVIIDRCNFDYQQRHNWIKFAHKFGYQIEIAWLDLPPEVCKQRVFVRKDHPTIQEGDSGFAIIDRFASMLTAPMKAEGFSRIYLLHTEEEVNQFAETYLS
ncbi:60S ribosomal protein L44 Q [Balamuthia mandrillaris]